MLTCTGLSLYQWPLPKLCCIEGTDVVGSFSDSETSHLRSSFITYVQSLGAVPTGVQQISSKTPKYLLTSLWTLIPEIVRLYLVYTCRLTKLYTENKIKISYSVNFVVYSNNHRGKPITYFD